MSLQAHGRSSRTAHALAGSWLVFEERPCPCRVVSGSRNSHVSAGSVLALEERPCPCSVVSGVRGTPMSLQGRGWRSRNAHAPAGSCLARGTPMFLQGRGWRSRIAHVPARSWHARAGSCVALEECPCPCRVVASARGMPMPLQARGLRPRNAHVLAESLLALEECQCQWRSRAHGLACANGGIPANNVRRQQLVKHFLKQSKGSLPLLALLA